MIKRNRRFRIAGARTTRSRLISGIAASGALALAVVAVPNATAHAAPAGCGLKQGVLSITDLPAGTSAVACGAVGRVIALNGAGVTVPEPGMAAGVEALSTTGGAHGLQIEVAKDGTISYSDTSDGGTASSASSTEPLVAGADGVSAAAALGACSDGAYNTNDLKEKGTYNWYIGDGGMPGALSRSDAQVAFADAINNITGSYNNCDYTDTVDAKASYQGTTTYESDVNSSGNCTDRDEKSTWDAGDLPSGTVAITCWWSWATPGAANDLREADVRYNTADYDFTNNPTSSCSNKFDIRSVGTHEAGHVFGMGHVSGDSHSNLTMYTDSFRCSTKARTLGKGDVLGLRSIY